MFIEEMSFQVTADDMEGRIITQFGGLFSCGCSRISV